MKLWSKFPNIWLILNWLFIIFNAMQFQNNQFFIKKLFVCHSFKNMSVSLTVNLNWTIFQCTPFDFVSHAAPQKGRPFARPLCTSTCSDSTTAGKNLAKLLSLWVSSADNNKIEINMLRQTFLNCHDVILYNFGWDFFFNQVYLSWDRV